MLKTTKRYVLNTNEINNYGYRVLTDGIDMSNFNNNPVMLWLHYRPTGHNKNEVLALGCMKDITIDKNGVMTGQPYFDDTDEFAKSIYNKYENGTYNMFSLCALPLEASVEPADLVPGQTGPTITKSLLKEFSAVDIGGQPDAYGVELCDEDGKLIKLSDKTITKLIPEKKPINMELTKASIAALLPQLKLADSATESEAVSAITKLIQLADNQHQAIITLKDEKTAAEIKVDELTTQIAAEIKLKDEAELKAVEVEAIAGRKVTKQEFDALVKLVDGKVDKVKEYLKDKPSNPSIKEAIANKVTGTATELEPLLKLSYQELDKAGKLIKLKDLDPDAFNLKYKERFGKDYAGK